MKTETKIFIGVAAVGLAYMYYRYKNKKQHQSQPQDNSIVTEQPQPQDNSIVTEQPQVATVPSVAIDNLSTPRNESAMNQQQITMVDQMRIERDLQMHHISLKFISTGEHKNLPRLLDGQVVPMTYISFGKSGLWVQGTYPNGQVFEQSWIWKMSESQKYYIG